MGKGLDGKFINYGIRQDDLMLISTLCEKHQVDFEWLKEEILRKFHAARVDKIEMSDADTQTIYGNLSKEGLKVNIDDGKSIERLKDANGDPIKFKTPAAALMYFLSEGWNLYVNGTSTEGYSYQGTGGSVSTSYWIFRKPCTKEVFEKAVEEGVKK